MEPDQIEGLPRYLVDLPSLAQLRYAIESGDENCLWELQARSPDPAVFMDWVGSLATGFVHNIPHPRDRGRSVKEYHSLFALPVVLWGTVHIPGHGEPGSRKVFEGVRKSLEAWSDCPDTEVRLFATVFDYADVCCWTPCQVYSRVAELGNARARRAWQRTSSLRQAPSLPRLSFLVGSLQKTFGYPEMPLAGTVSQLVLDGALKGWLSLLGEGASPVLSIGHPEMFTDGVRSGLVHHVDRLTQCLAMRGWSIAPSAIDAVNLTLHGQDPGDDCEIPIRLHHIGHHGLDLVLERLAHLPMLPPGAGASAH